MDSATGMCIASVVVFSARHRSCYTLDSIHGSGIFLPVVRVSRTQIRKCLNLIAFQVNE